MLAGTNALAGDSKSLRWQSSDPAVLQVAPASLSGTAVNDEIQITALTAGRECTVTVSHEKTNANLILYCIIPGENAASVTLDRSTVNLIEGDSPFGLSASVTNAQENDYALLQWSIEQQQPQAAAEISGSGKKITILPKREGSALISVRVPSSGKTASCAVIIEKPKTLAFSTKSISTYPGEVFALSYTVNPPSEINTLTWSVSDSSFVQLVDNKNGTATVYAKYKEGTAVITGTTASRASASVTVINGWGNTFSLEKSLIKSIPVQNNDGTFDVNYEVKPACAEIRVWGLSNMTLRPGTYDSFSNGVYTLLPARHTSVDSATGIAGGTIRFNPSGESKTSVIVQAWNPVASSSIDGTITPAEIASRQIQMNVYYNNYTFLPQNVSKNGKYSRYDAASGSFIIGDGEQMTFSFAVTEQNGTPQIEEVRFEPNGAEPAGPDGTRQRSFISASTVTGNGSFAAEHSRDYGSASSLFYGLANAADWIIEQYNPTVRAVPLAGMITVRYRLFGSSGIQEFRFPLYVEVRNCLKTY